MTFAEVVRIVGETMPASASRHSAWWGSDPKHTQAVWLDVGYIARSNLTAGRVVFERTAPLTHDNIRAAPGRHRAHRLNRSPAHPT
ncbi:hypothetical protein AB0392_11325 [Nonomuraea angiospora]|uniref:DUF7662 domain-containing protein n=1 Tax=Nonomuraea angiospora TaxID=46172 RepID=UPI00344EC0B7